MPRPRTTRAQPPLPHQVVAACWRGPRTLPRPGRLEWRFMVVRWLGILAMLAGLPFLSLSADGNLVAYAIVGAAAAYNLSVAHVLLRGSGLGVLRYVTTVSDCVLNVAMLLAVGGGFAS